MRTYLIAVALAALLPTTGAAQNPHADRRQVEVGLGLASPVLQGGTELLRARDLRADGQSYFAGPNGARRGVGEYPALFGFSIHLAFQEPVRRVDGLMLGASARSTLTGSQPSQGGYGEGYFFNSVTTGLTAKLYPFATSGVFLRGEAGLGAVFTKNRFLNAAARQEFQHQFGIGPAGAFGAGYTLTPFRAGTTGLDIQALYQQLRSRVEVNGIGDDQWSSGALHLVVSVTF